MSVLTQQQPQTQKTGKLAGKVALVTGGSRGIGAAIAKALASEGASVAISYAASAKKAEALVKELEADGTNAIAIQADQGERAQVQLLVNTVYRHFGQLDILVNNAGVIQPSPVDDALANQESLEHLFAVNVGGVATAIRTAAPLMKEGGRIVSIGSVLGARVPLAGLTDYAASKFAVAGYTKGWARELGPRGITVNAVQPGPIDTDMNPDGSEFAEAHKKSIALGRYGKPEEVAAAVAFLVSPEASYITGTTLDVDGGHNA